MSIWNIPTHNFYFSWKLNDNRPSLFAFRFFFLIQTRLDTLTHPLQPVFPPSILLFCWFFRCWVSICPHGWNSFSRQENKSSFPLNQDKILLDKEGKQGRPQPNSKAGFGDCRRYLPRRIKGHNKNGEENKISPDANHPENYVTSTSLAPMQTPSISSFTSITFFLSFHRTFFPLRITLPLKQYFYTKCPGVFRDSCRFFLILLRITPLNI